MRLEADVFLPDPEMTGLDMWFGAVMVKSAEKSMAERDATRYKS
jgi:hypothetical protein